MSENKEEETSSTKKCSATIRELSSLIPPFTSPATMWSARISMIIRHVDAEFGLVRDVVVSKLPDKMFTKMQQRRTSNIDELLAAIVQLDRDSTLKTATQLFTRKAAITDTSKPSDLFCELIEQTKQLLPAAGDETIQEVAKAKLLTLLTNAAQVAMLTHQHTLPIEKLLEILDALPTHTEREEAISRITDEHTDAPSCTEQAKSLEAIALRLDRIEPQQWNDNRNGRGPHVNSKVEHFPPSRTNMNRNNAWCFYHNKFGHFARNCCQPCTYATFQKTEMEPRLPKTRKSPQNRNVSEILQWLVFRTSTDRWRPCASPSRFRCRCLRPSS